MHTLYFDAKCPICSTFARVLSSRVSPMQLRMMPLSGESDEFKLATPEGVMLSGPEALNRLLVDFPEIESFFSLLPQSWRQGAVRTAVAAAGVARNVMNKFKPCNCGKKR